MDTSSFVEQAAQSMAKLHEHQKRLDEVKRGLSKATESATSRDRGITVRVGGEGQLLEFQFHSEEFRAMPAAELSAMLVQLANEARQKMARRVADSFAPLSAFGAQLRKSMTSGSALEDVVAPLREAHKRMNAAHYDDEEY